MKIIFLGAPGAGKGTQAAAVSKEFGIPTISTGNMIREAIANGTPVGLAAKDIIAKGQLVSDEIVVEIVKEKLKTIEGGYILDGFPRTGAQAKAMEELGIYIDKVVEISVPDDEIVKRISGRRNCKDCGTIYHMTDNPSKSGDRCDKCGGELVCRADDTEETVRKRLAVYHEETKPVSDYYEAKGEMIKIDSSGTVEQTTAALWKALGVHK